MTEHAMSEPSMTEPPIDPSTRPAEEKLQDAVATERLETDPDQEPNAPNQEPEQEIVGPTGD